jgi:tetratricopeptide (TPR) repeat protein
MFKIRIPIDNDFDHICEVQVHHAAIKELDIAIGSHEHYEYFRVLYAGSDETVTARRDDLSQILHGVDRLNDHFLERLIKSADIQRLEMLASLCDEKLAEYDVAHRLLLRVLELASILGKDHPGMAISYNNIALILKKKGKYNGALEQYEKALAIVESVHGTDHPTTATIYNNIGLVLTEKGDYDGALLQYEKLVAVRESVLGKDHLDTASTYNNLALVFLNKKGD